MAPGSLSSNLEMLLLGKSNDPLISQLIDCNVMSYILLSMAIPHGLTNFPLSTFALQLRS